MPTSARRVAASIVLSAFLSAAGAAASTGAADPAAAAQSAFSAAHPQTAFERSADRITSVFGNAFSTGATAEASAAAFVQQHAALFNVDAAELAPLSILEDQRPTQPVWFEPDTGRFKFTMVYYSQFKDGYPVYMADLRLLVRNDPGFPLVHAGSALRDLRGFQVPADAAKHIIDPKLAYAAADAYRPGVAFTTYSQPTLVVWAGVDNMQVQPALCYQFTAQTASRTAPGYERWLFLVDALSLDANGTAQVAYAESLVNNIDVNGTVQAMATADYRAAACSTLSTRPLPYARVSIGSTVAYANAAGAFSIPNPDATPVTVTSGVRGRWFRVWGPGAAPTDPFIDAATLSTIVSPPGPATFLHNTSQAQNTTAEVNTYIAANEARDHVLTYNPAFPTIANQTEFTINVMLNDTCNAFYDGGSINFFAAGGGCNNTGFGTVVHHEYGHHVVNRAGSGQGQYGEGYGDCLGLVITDNPVTGIGFSSCGAGIRTAANSLQYPCTGEVHACGRLISGCVWSVRNRLATANPSGYRALLSNLVINSVLMHQGSLVEPNINIHWLTLDDDDSNIFNGTPHLTQINLGFAEHNMLAPAVTFTYPAGRPSLISTAGGTSFPVQVNASRLAPLPGSATLSYSTGGAYTTIPLTTTGTPNVYTATFPPLPCGPVSYYISTRNTLDSAVAADPPTAPASVFTATSATGAPVVFSDDFEIDRGWTVGSPADNAVTGIWVRVNPVGTDAQPENDHTPAPGTMCFVTGQGPVGGGLGDNDVDGGQTTLTSPILNLAGMESPRISYWRWYSNNTGGAPGADVFVVDISPDGVNWTRAETVGPTGPETVGGWFYHEFDVASFITPTSTVRVRFIASDVGEGSLIEAAVDDFQVQSIQCDAACPADWDSDGQVLPADVAAFVSAWFNSLNQGTLVGDFDNSGAVNPADVAAFIGAWFTAVNAGC